MIYEVCANCAWGSNIQDATGQIQITMCSYMPIMIAEYPNHRCGCFKMSANPQVFDDVEERPSNDVEG